MSSRYPSLSEGTECEHRDEDWKCVVLGSVKTAGVPVHELDTKQVRVEHDNGRVAQIPLKQFGGHNPLWVRA